MMKYLLVLFCGVILSNNMAFAEIFDASLKLAHDSDKMAQLELGVSGELFNQLKSSNSDSLVHFQIVRADGTKVYSNPQDLFFEAFFILFNSSKNSYFATINLFHESLLNNEDIVLFFTQLHESKIIFYKKEGDIYKKSGEFSLNPICSSNKTLNLSGANKCEIAPEQVTSLPLASGQCEDNETLKSWKKNLCIEGLEKMKKKVEQSYGCQFNCQ